MKRKMITAAADQQAAIDEIIEEIKGDDLLEIFVVGKDKHNRFAFYSAGRLHGLGTAASIMQAEFSKEWVD